MKKIILLTLSLLLVCATLLGLTACVTPDGTTDAGTSQGGSQGGEPDGEVTLSGQVNVKFFKVGKANATLIRSGDIAILVDTGDEKDEDTNNKQDDGEKILAYLAEKGVTELDYVIISQFNKKHYGSLSTILEGVTVKNVIEPSYAKTGTSYDDYRAALAKANITPEVVKTTKELTAGGLKLTLYPTSKTTTSADLDEFYSLAIAVESNGLDLLIASDIFGARIPELITALGGKTFDILQVPKHGAFDDQVESLIDAVSPKYAVIFASVNNPADTRTLNLLSEKNITTYVTMNGSVEAKYKNSELTIKQ